MKPAIATFIELLLALLITLAAPSFAQAQGARPQPARENYKTADGLAVSLGIIPAAMVRGHPKGHPEQAMHEGVPRGAHEYHVTVAIFDAASGERLETAEVDATVSPLGPSG